MKQTIALFLLGLVAAVALAGLINLDSNTGLFATKGSIVLHGGIYDNAGYVLFTKRQQRYQSLYNSVVAVAPDGRVVGQGPLSPGHYRLTLHDNWRDYPRLFIQVGFYDAVRPERNSLYDCTVLDTVTLQERYGRRSSYRVPMDLYCSGFETLQPARKLAYR
ncbi:MAG: hypothetical protein QW165_04605 [Candidatus Woesearchaeota archaeon]